MSYQHITALDDPAKPYKRVWLCEATGFYVKTHAVRRNVGFGRVKWDMTGSLCGADGKAIRDDAGAPLIHLEGHGLSVQTDQGLRYVDARDLVLELLRDDDPATVERIKSQAIALTQAAPTVEEVEQMIAEDFERELRFVVAKVERAALNMRAAEGLGGVKESA